MNRIATDLCWCGRPIFHWMDEVDEPAKERFRRAEIADWRRKYRKTMLLKVLGGVGLIILICGGTLSALYALNC